MRLRTALQKQRLSFHPSSPIAHRGNCGDELVPENTLAAVSAAWKRGAKWVECDVNITVDGELIILHDDTLRRTTNAEGAFADTSVAKMTYAEIAAFTAGGKAGPAFAGEKVPTLRQFISLIKKLNMGLVLELKPSIGQEIQVAQQTIELLKELDFINSPRLLVQSFLVECLREVKRLQPALNIGLLVEEWAVYTRLNTGIAGYPESGINICRESVEDILRELDCTALVACHSVLNKECVANVRKNTRTPFVLTWTLDDRARADELFSYGVDAVITDHPERYIAAQALNMAANKSSLFSSAAGVTPKDASQEHHGACILGGAELK